MDVGGRRDGHGTSGQIGHSGFFLAGRVPAISVYARRVLHSIIVSLRGPLLLTLLLKIA